ncbi:aldo/keto reductase [Staphylococcus arlettae]|jgi:diketogulonate reductase-like aldo/keto reductase|uniref:Aldo keto reductase n=1 Tax=Staphylococcus arlettae TaxID=29378 RepID=A0A380CNV1_9STAP|nr:MULTISPECIES: aldo/keto reductase [Staphylococcus]EJY96750.1 aldo keto reductase [Staphylococcus arlettae CVD059]KAB2480918.1 aldo/keto reductase [Staphylococcus sp. CH99b_3]MCD8816364.1 aldo/keto reductase [Staphylococcus arlettae]MCD8839639.1 aldo/keto reductase [Staphylococcus arlettae]MCD8841594.1 aldo/keto reductase [Staphylococcus arlettae]
MENDVYYLNNGYPMPKIGLGVYKITDNEMATAIESALEVGYRAFDTAYLYDNEVALGRVLKQSEIARDSLFITSKLWNDYQGFESTLKQFNQSLERLGTDYLDLYLIHWPCAEDDLFIESYKALEQLYEEGKVRAIGVCNFTKEHLEKLMDATDIVPAVNQVEVHPYFNQQQLQDFCDDNDIAVTAWMPLMRNRGLLDDPVIVEIAKRYNKTPAQVVLRWHLAHNRLIIPKSKTPERIEENFNIFDFNLEVTDIAEIDALNRNDRQGHDPDSVKIGTLR